MEIIKWPVVIWKVSPFKFDTVIADTTRELERRYLNDDGSHKIDNDGSPFLPSGPGAQIAPGAEDDMPRIWLDMKYLYKSAQTTGNMVFDDSRMQKSQVDITM